jgi:hypothetical protein
MLGKDEKIGGKRSAAGEGSRPRSAGEVKPRTPLAILERTGLRIILGELGI